MKKLKLFVLCITTLLLVLACNPLGTDVMEEEINTLEVQQNSRGSSVSNYQIHGIYVTWYEYDTFFKQGAYYYRKVSDSSRVKHQISQKSKQRNNDALSNFIVRDNKAYWFFYDGFLKRSAYYSKNLSNTRSGFKQVTQIAKRFNNDAIMSFKVISGYAHWCFYDGFRRETAYYAVSLLRGNYTRKKITQTAKRFNNDSISSFKVVRGYAHWYFYDGFFKRGANHSKSLKSLF